MKSLIIYSSRSGNTKRLAEFAYNALKGEKKLVSITELPLEKYDYDLVAVGFRSRPFPWLKEAEGAKGHPDISDMESLAALLNTFT